jgi:hypothetical protein
MARILWLPPGLLQGSTCSFSPTDSDHSVSDGVRCTPATAQGPFAPEALPSILAPTGPCAGPVASMPLRPRSKRHWSLPFMPSTAGPPDRPSFDAVASSESVVPRTTGARSVYGRFLPKRQRPLPPTDGSAHSKWPRKRLHAGPNFRRCRHFLRLRPSRSLALLIAPTPLCAAKALSLELAWDSFPPPKSSQLPGRIDQFPGQDSHLLVTEFC